MSAIVKRIVRESECLNDRELRTVIDSLVDTFEKRMAKRKRFEELEAAYQVKG